MKKSGTIFIKSQPEIKPTFRPEAQLQPKPEHASGVISVASNVAPRAVQRFASLLLEGNLDILQKHLR